MGINYTILGAGRQGTAAAYDLIKFGNPDDVLLVDQDANAAKRSAERINELTDDSIAQGTMGNVADTDELSSILKGTDSILSAVPYKFNLELTKMAIDLGANFCDLGGHTGIVRRQLALDTKAQDAGISIVPDCGMGPGMNISLADYAMSLVDSPKHVYIWDGGLPQDPKPPWNYALTFNINGLTNEYFGNAYFLRNRRITEIPCFHGYELLDFPEPIGQLEAFVTSGGLSTAPWSYEGTLETLENKTLRYPGHHAQFSSFSQLGLFSEDPIHVNEGMDELVPRDVFHALLGPKIIPPGLKIRDIAVMRVKCVGGSEVNGGSDKQVSTIDLVDLYDEKTGFTAMQRLTGWHASIMTILMTQGKVEKGTHSVEKAVPGSVVVEEALKRGFAIKATEDLGDGPVKTSLTM